MSESEDFLSDNKVIEEFQRIQSQSKYLTDYCRENSIPIFSGNLKKLSENYNIVELYTIDSIDNPFAKTKRLIDNWDYLVSRLKHCKPDFVILEKVIKHHSLEETFGYYVWHKKIGLAVDSDLVKKVIHLHGKVISDYLGIKAFLFFSKEKICITYILGGDLTCVLKKYEKTEEDFEREAEEEDSAYFEEDEAEDLEYQKEQEERNAKIEVLARELSKERKLLLTKNREQREAVTREFFGKRMSEIDSWDIEPIARRAIDIFDFEELPSLVSELKNQGKTQKQISDELGIGLAKIKKVFAIASQD